MTIGQRSALAILLKQQAELMSGLAAVMLKLNLDSIAEEIVDKARVADYAAVAVHPNVNTIIDNIRDKVCP